MTAIAQKLFPVLALGALLAGCGPGGANDPATEPVPTPTPAMAEEGAFDLDVALALGRLCLQSYQMLSDFEAGKAFTLPAPYTLRAQLFTAERYPGEDAGDPASPAEEVPIAFVATGGDAIYVVFRGTKTISEWISDATFTQVPYPAVADGGRTETGFTTIYATISSAIVAEVSALAQSSEYATLYVTGHSLGAALAVLAAPELVRATRFAAPVVYNFAGPRTGDPEFAALVGALPGLWRVVNTNDEVPKLPPAVTVVVHGDEKEILFYEHVGREYAITFGAPIRDLTDLEEDHAMCNYYATLCAQTADPPACDALADGADGCDPS